MSGLDLKKTIKILLAVYYRCMMIIKLINLIMRESNNDYLWPKIFNIGMIAIVSIF